MKTTYLFSSSVLLLVSCASGLIVGDTFTLLNNEYGLYHTVDAREVEITEIMNKHYARLKN